MSGPATAPFALLSHHRSGSNFMVDVLQQHPAVDLIDEPFSMHTKYFSEVDLLRWQGDDYRSDVLHDELAGRAGLRSFVDDLFGFLRTPRTGIRGFKETMLFEKLPWLARAVPGLRLIYLVRDPRAVASSVMRHPSAKQWNYEVTVPRYLRRYRPGRDPEPASYAELIAASWQIRDQELRAHADLLPVHTVRLEDLVLDPANTLAAVMDFLGLSCAAGQLDFIRASRLETRGGPYSTFRRPEDVLDSWKRDVSPTEVRAVQQRLAEQMAGYGYF